MNRLETDFGNVSHDSRLKTFIAYYRFQDRTWSIRVWAGDWDEARDYCRIHNLRLTGEFVEELD